MPASAVRTCAFWPTEGVRDGRKRKRAQVPLPSEIADAPGAEGWRSMYPYFTRFQPEDDQRFWFYNSMHFPEPMPASTPSRPRSRTARSAPTPPVCSSSPPRSASSTGSSTGASTSPPSRSPTPRRSGAAAIFGERAAHYYENWDDLYEGWKLRMRELIRQIEAITVPELPEFEDSSVVTEARGVAQNHYVRENFHRCIDLFSKMWHHHTEMLMLGYGAYVVFFQFCKQAFPEISDQTAARMVAGIDVIMYRPDDELRKLARIAVKAGVDDLFTEGCSSAGVLWPWQAGRGRPDLARRVRAGPRALVQRLHRRRLLPPPPQLGRRPDGPVHGAPRVTSPRCAPAGWPTARPRRCGRSGNGSRPSTASSLSARRSGARSTRCSVCPAGLPVRRGSQVLLRALVHQPVLRQDPRVRRAAIPVRGAGRGRGRVPAAPHRDRPGAV